MLVQGDQWLPTQFLFCEHMEQLGNIIAYYELEELHSASMLALIRELPGLEAHYSLVT
jgi:hypothetical protein